MKKVGEYANMHFFKNKASTGEDALAEMVNEEVPALKQFLYGC